MTSATCVIPGLALARSLSVKVSVLGIVITPRKKVLDYSVSYFQGPYTRGISNFMDEALTQGHLACCIGAGREQKKQRSIGRSGRI
jgi:hypothetical protein